MERLHLILIFIISFLLSYSLTIIVRKYCLTKGYYDKPDSVRKIHNHNIPVLGGVAIYVSFAASSIIAVIVMRATGFQSKGEYHYLIGLFFCSSIIFLLGLYDDTRQVKASKKVLIEVAGAVLLFYFGFRMETVSNPFGSPINFGYFALPATVLWVVGITNAINLIDGIDGLAAGVSFLVLITLGLIGVTAGSQIPLISAVAILLCGSILGFLPHNYPPAKVFMGDSGSLTIGFLIAAISIQSSLKGSTTMILIIPLILLLHPIVDVLSSITRRILKGVSPFSADKEHLHHKVLSYMSQTRSPARSALFLFYGISILTSLLAFSMAVLKVESTNVLLFALFFAVGICIAINIKCFSKPLFACLFVNNSYLSRINKKVDGIEEKVSSSQWSLLAKKLDDMPFDIVNFNISSSLDESNNYNLVWINGKGIINREYNGIYVPFEQDNKDKLLFSIPVIDEQGANIGKIVATRKIQSSNDYEELFRQAYELSKIAGSGAYEAETFVNKSQLTNII